MKTKLSIRPILFSLFILLVFSLSFSGMSCDSGDTKSGETITTNYVTVDDGKKIETVTTYKGTATSFTGRGEENYSVGYFIKDGTLIAEDSLLADEDEAVSSLDLDLESKGPAFNPVIATGKETDLTLTGSISATDNGDGSKASDFSALGTMILAKDYAKVNVDSMKIYTEGFLRAAFITDNHASILVRDTDATTMGANPLTESYEEYVNSANQSIMLSPPWVLGIQGGIRAANMLGDNSSLTVIDSKISSGGWAVLSTDACTNPKMNIVDSTLEILPESEGGMSSGNFSYSSEYGSGYGTYLIGSAQQHFYGAKFNGTTYASILTGGDGYYRSSSGRIELKDADGKAIETVSGKGKPTTVNSVFGFMAHNQGSINVLDGTVVNSEEAVFLHKAGSVDFVVDNAELNSGTGIILQMIDNDDRTVGGSMAAFNTEFNEDPGWPSENGNVTEPGSGSAAGPGDMPGREGDMPGGEGGMPGREGGMPEGGGPPGGGGSASVNLILTNGSYKGDVFNGSGYYTQTGNELEVSIGEGASLDGTISLTETRHVDENGNQNTLFTINEYYYLGHVENRNYRNKTSAVSVNLKDGGKWNVTGESLISKLVIDGGTIEGANGARIVMTVDGRETPIKDGEIYEGDIVISLQ